MRNILIAAVAISAIAAPALAQSASEPRGYGNLGYTHLDDTSTGAVTGRLGVNLNRFIALERRTTAARGARADLFVSLHADMLPKAQAAGATIYTWDAQSNDRAARQLALRHDRSDMLAGLDLSDTDEDVSRALMDLARIDTQPRSQDAARHLVTKLNEAGVVMHRTPVRGAARPDRRVGRDRPPGCPSRSTRRA